MHSNEIKISIIMPVYNVKDYIRDCLDSILIQTFSDFELICINDGSTDGTEIILEEYASKDPRVTIINQPNMGVSVARNKGIEHASGSVCICR